MTRYASLQNALFPTASGASSIQLKKSRNKLNVRIGPYRTQPGPDEPPQDRKIRKKELKGKSLAWAVRSSEWSNDFPPN